jgi:hypothetical protein
VEAAKIVLDSIHSIWEEWRLSNRSFKGELSEMQKAFKAPIDERLMPMGLESRLPPGWQVNVIGKRPDGKNCQPWSKYDIAVFEDSRPVGLFELASHDITVCHALHDGELKLLGISEGANTLTGETFAEHCRLSSEEVAKVGRQLSDFAVRGLFFVNASDGRRLDELEPPDWWPTWDGVPQNERTFRSSLMADEGQITLRRAFKGLAERGLFCWFYSLCGEDSVEFMPTDSCRRGIDDWTKREQDVPRREGGIV